MSEFCQVCSATVCLISHPSNSVNRNGGTDIYWEAELSVCQLKQNFSIIKLRLKDKKKKNMTARRREILPQSTPTDGQNTNIFAKLVCLVFNLHSIVFFFFFNTQKNVCLLWFWILIRNAVSTTPWSKEALPNPEGGGLNDGALFLKWPPLKFPKLNWMWSSLLCRCDPWFSQDRASPCPCRDSLTKAFVWIINYRF